MDDTTAKSAEACTESSNELLEAPAKPIWELFAFTPQPEQPTVEPVYVVSIASHSGSNS